MLKAVARRLGRINISLVPWDWEKEEYRVDVHPMTRDPFKSIGAFWVPENATQVYNDPETVTKTEMSNLKLTQFPVRFR